MARIDQTADASLLAAVQDDMTHCAVPVRDDFTQAHALFLTRLSMPGNWWTGAERVAIAAATRSARMCVFCEERRAALSPYAVSGTHDVDPQFAGALPTAMVDIIHLATTDATRMTQAAIENLADDGLSGAHFVEALGIAAAIRSVDQACRGLGVPLHDLPTPIAGAPSRVRPADAQMGEAFVPMLPADYPAAPNDDLWDEQGAFGLRAMSLVPDAVRDLLLLSAAHYVGIDAAFDMSKGRTLGREQMELLAGRVSAINDCFY
jgi:hypothetical protein